MPRERADSPSSSRRPPAPWVAGGVVPLKVSVDPRLGEQPLPRRGTVGPVYTRLQARLASIPVREGRRGVVMIEPRTIETWYAGFVRRVGESASPGDAEVYFLKPGYQSRERPDYFLDDLDGVVYQPDVYPLAMQLARAVGAQTLIDIGCGRAQKLLEHASPFETIGIDFGENLAWCRQRYPTRRWLESDLDRPHKLPVPARDLQQSVLICSDVLEHLVHPEYLLSSLRAALEHAPALLLSTPERDLTRGVTDTGPPSNTCHVREWNLSEFARLLDHYGLPLRRIGLTRSDDQSNLMHTMLAIVVRRRASRSDARSNRRARHVDRRRHAGR